MQLLVPNFSCTYSSGVGSVLVLFDGVLTLVKVSDNRLQGTVRVDWWCISTTESMLSSCIDSVKGGGGSGFVIACSSGPV